MDDPKAVTGQTKHNDQGLQQNLHEINFPPLASTLHHMGSDEGYSGAVTEQTEHKDQELQQNTNDNIFSDPVTEYTEEELQTIVHNQEFPLLKSTNKLPVVPLKSDTVLPKKLNIHERDLKIMELEALQEAGVSNEEDDKLLNELLKELEAEIAQVEDTGVVTTSPAPSSEGVTPSDDYDQFSESESQVTQPINERAKSGGETQSEGEGKSEEESEEHAEEIYVSVCY